MDTSLSASEVQQKNDLYVLSTYGHFAVNV